MTDDIQPLENQLQTLRPAAPEEAFAARLAAIARPAAPDAAMEDFLRGLRPAAVESALMDAILARTSARPATVIPFAAAKRSWSRLALPVAAAVALLGAATALFVPTGRTGGGAPVAVQQTPRSATPVAPPFAHNGALQPAGFNSKLDKARDEGVIWRQPNRPHRVLRATYLDHATFVDAQGRTIVVEQPRTEYFLIPETID